MSADIEKMAVFDDRIVQSRPRYAVEKGALSVTNSPFNAIAANTSQHTYNVLVPSENIFIDRAIDWTSTAYFSATLVAPAGAGTGALVNPTEVPLVQQGANAALCPFPLQSLTTTMTATINDTTVTINSADVLPQVLRMTDMRKNRLVRTCPTMLDRYQVNSTNVGANNSPLAGYDCAVNSDLVPNGAFAGLVWTTSAGLPLTQALVGGVYQAPAADGGWVATTARPYPCMPTTAQNASGYWNIDAPNNCQVYFSVTSCEKLVLSPFVFADVHEWDTGLFGCQNIQLVMNLAPPARVLRYAPLLVSGATNAQTYQLANTQYNQAGSGSGAFANSRVNIQFLTPSLDVPLPPKSVVPYMEYPRYISSQLQAMPAAGTQATVYSSQTITLPQIPDLLIIYAKPAQGYTYPTTGVPGAPPNQFGGSPDPNQNDFMFPITGISVNFDNFAGLLSAHTTQQLYKMTVHNGLEQDWQSWSGSSWSSIAGGLVSTVGGMLVLKPGRDIVLQAGQAPSLVGNFVLQFNLSLLNNTGAQVSPQIYVITANSGFFETIKGSSRVIKGVLTEQDIISAPVAPGGTSGALRRAVGAGVHSSMGNALHHLKSMFGGETHQKMPSEKTGMAGGAMKRGSGKPQQVAQALASGLASRLM